MGEVVGDGDGRDGVGDGNRIVVEGLEEVSDDLY